MLFMFMRKAALDSKVSVTPGHQFDVIHNLSERALYPTTNKKCEKYQLPWYFISTKASFGFCTTAHNILSLSVQVFFHPPHQFFTTSPSCMYKYAVRDCIKRLVSISPLCVFSYILLQNGAFSWSIGFLLTLNCCANHHSLVKKSWRNVTGKDSTAQIPFYSNSACSHMHFKNQQC